MIDMLYQRRFFLFFLISITAMALSGSFGIGLGTAFFPPCSRHRYARRVFLCILSVLKVGMQCMEMDMSTDLSLLWK